MARYPPAKRRALQAHRKAFRESFARVETSHTRAAIIVGGHAVAYVQARVEAVPAGDRGRRRAERAAAVARLARDVGCSPEYVNRACSIAEFARLVPQAAKLPYYAIRELARAIDTNLADARWTMPAERQKTACKYVTKIIGKVIAEDIIRRAVNHWKCRGPTKLAARRSAVKQINPSQAAAKARSALDSCVSRADALMELGEQVDMEDIVAILSGFANQVDSQLRVARDNGQPVSWAHPSVQTWQQLIARLERLTHTMQMMGTMPGIHLPQFHVNPQPENAAMAPE
jgi:hypothetical protein